MVNITRIIIVFLCLFAFSNTLFCQNQYSKSIDSLKLKLQQSTTDTEKIKILNQLSSSNYYINPKVGLYYGEAALKLAEKTHWKKGMAIATNNLGVCQFMLNDFQKATSYFFKSLSIYEELKDQNGIATALNDIGLLYKEQKNHEKALYFFYKSLKINKLASNEMSLVYILNNIADVYYKKGNYTKSIEYYSKSKDLNQSMNDLNGLAYNYAQIGKIYSAQGEFTKGLDFFSKALANYDEKQTINIGDVYIEIGRTYYNMAMTNPKNKKDFLELSVLNLKKSLDHFEKIGTLDSINILNFELYKAYKELEEYELAQIYLERHTALKDKLSFNQSQNKIANLQSDQKIELRDKQIIIQNLKIKSDSRKLYLLVTIIVPFIVLLLVLFWLYISKRNTNFQLKEKNETISDINAQKDKFFSIIAHDLKGPFNGFLGLSELLAEDLDSMDKEEIQFAAGSMRNSAMNLNRLLENLLEWSRIEQGLIPFNPEEIELLTVVTDCVVTLRDTANKKEIQINIDLDENTKVFADDNMLHAVIRNLLSNAIKFTPKSGTIIIQGKEDDKNTTISINDTGIGMNAKMVENLFKLDIQTNRKGTNDEPSTGLGLILCKGFVEKHGGEIWAESKEGKGTRFYARFPKRNQ
jgi:signal transduction histidine kinase